MPLNTARPGDRGYANPELLAPTDWLQEHLDDPGVRIVDADRPDAYPRVHIPGAVAVEDNFLKGGEDRLHVQGPDAFAAAMSSLGISNDTFVVVYDSDGSHYAARLLWALNYYGHSRVAVLDGGFPKWFAEGRPLSREAPRHPPGHFEARPSANLLARKRDVLAAVGDAGTVFLDVRTDEEWTGENDRGTARGGRIPGAVHMEWKNFLTPGDVPLIKPARELRQLLESVGATPDKNVVTY